jgi:hypothetical protein
MTEDKPRLAPDSFGTLFVARPPIYHDPISVNSPFCVSIAAFGPTFDTEERNAPKYE